MILLYQAGNSSDFTIIREGLTREQCHLITENAARLLIARSQKRASDILRKLSFRVMDATNSFGNEFSILHAVVPLEEYESLRNSKQDASEQKAFQQIAKTFEELGHYIWYIAIDLVLERPVAHGAKLGYGLKESEINKLVYKYIGVDGGYLADFSYHTHHEFYIELGLDINPYEYDGTTRARFMTILREGEPQVQARILEGILKRYPENSSELRTSERAAEIRGWIKRLRSGPNVEEPELDITSDVVDRALLDAQELIRTTGAASGVDRIHTVLHGYLRQVCDDAGIDTTKDASMTDLFKQMRISHPAFQDLGPRKDDIQRVLHALATILDSLNTIRNKASVAHPSPTLLPEPEAMLIINTARTILHFLNEKIVRY
jgi:hypothetical protein